MVKQIHDLEIDEISLVKKGANQHALVTIAKSAEGNTMGDDLDIYDETGQPLDASSLEHGDVVYDEDGNGYVFDENAEDDDTEDYDDEEVGKALNFSGRAFNAGQKLSRGRLGQAQVRRATAPSGVPQIGPGSGSGEGFTRVRTGRIRNRQPRVGPYEGGATTAGNGPATRSRRNRNLAFGAAGGAGVAGAGAGAVVYNKRDKFGKSYAEEVREALSKSMSDSERDEVISKALGDMDYFAEIAKSAQEAAAEERNMRLDREYTEIAKSYNLPIDPEDLGGVLRRCAEALDEDDCAVISKCMEAAGEAMFMEYGAVGGGDNGDVFSQVNAFANEQVSKSGGDINQTMMEIFAENPGLYEEYLRENHGQL